MRLELYAGGLEGEYVGVAVLTEVVARRGRGKQLLGILPHEFGPVVVVELFEFSVQRRPGLCAPVNGRTPIVKGAREQGGDMVVPGLRRPKEQEYHCQWHTNPTTPQQTFPRVAHSLLLGGCSQLREQSPSPPLALGMTSPLISFCFLQQFLATSA